MAFETMSERLRLVANRSLSHCRNQWGSNGIKQDEPIDARIGWRPTFFLKPKRVLIVAVEVGEVLFPDALKGAAHDIEQFNFPISIYQACPLDIYQQDPRLHRVKMLRDRGFGIITVDDDGGAIIQTHAEPLAQNISTEKLDEQLTKLTPRLKIKFREAHATYQANVGQGLQAVGQIVEAMIKCICIQAENAGKVPAGTNGKATAEIIDEMYFKPAFNNHRAALGAARSFVKTYRNIASHPAMTPKLEAERIRKCKAGFFEALRVAIELRIAMAQMHYRTNIQ